VKNETHIWPALHTNEVIVIGNSFMSVMRIHYSNLKPGELDCKFVINVF